MLSDSRQMEIKLTMQNHFAKEIIKYTIVLSKTCILYQVNVNLLTVIKFNNSNAYLCIHVKFTLRNLHFY